MPLLPPLVASPRNTATPIIDQRSPARATGVFFAILLTLGASSAFAASAQLTSLGPGLYDVQGQIGAGPIAPEYFVGVLHISIDGGPQTNAYCVDIAHGIRVGDVSPQIAPAYPCEVVYILNNAFPVANNIPGALGDTNREGAAVQAAIWKFTDNFNVTSPSDVVSRTAQIIAAAQNTCLSVPSVPQSVTVTPASATNIIDPGTQSGDTTHTVTATLYDTSNQPMAGHPIQLVVTGVAGPQTFDGTTNASGQFTITYTNTFVVTGNDTITASANFTVPVGLEFKAEDKQGIVLAGTPQSGTVSGSATKSWVTARCGDGTLNQAGEECDDGNHTEGDGCDSDCSASRCGNGIQAPNEPCDDGNLTNGDGCDANCTATGCGNGIRTGGEECDDGNLVDGDGCNSNCTLPRCGNQILDAGEECEDGNAVDGDGCDSSCTRTRCGNGIVTAGEQCDDGNQIDGDGCKSDCTVPGCGNGILDGNEQCDDGNVMNADGCEADCTLPYCGNAIVDAGEECDDGNGNDGDACESDCTLPVCGNGIVDASEGCDDGNTSDGDGCDASCRRQEICDDLVDNDGDGLIDCDDPDCHHCGAILKDPAHIKLRPSHLDRLYFSGGVIPIPPGQLDPVNEHVGFLLTNANGVIYRGELQPNDLKGSAAKFAFRDPSARFGSGTRDGLFKVKGLLRNGVYHFNVFAYADLTAATLPTMTLQIVVGDDAFFTKANWTKTLRGWRYEFPRIPDAVP